MKSPRLLIFGALVGLACPHAKPRVSQDAPRSLDASLPWYKDNREKLQAMIDRVGRKSPLYDEHQRPVAAFDWDNTVIKNDIGFGLFFWMLKNDKFLAPPKLDWSYHSKFLSRDGIAALEKACNPGAREGQPLLTSKNTACADELFTFYFDAKTKAGRPAFEKKENHRYMEPSFAWGAQLEAGYTHEQMKEFSQRTIEETLAAPEGATQTLGTSTLEGYVRVYPQSKDLIATLQSNGFDVWIVSASPQPTVEAFAEKIGISADRAIGIRLLTDQQGRFLPHLEGCADIKDGQDEIITYIDGKRCWINKVIFGQSGPEALLPNKDHKVAFAAGDTDSDTTFLKDAAFRLSINRNHQELMCYAYRYLGEDWLINPMFIAPNKAKADGYDCSRACKDKDGEDAPCVDLAGAQIPHQEDTAHP